jgi:hypothetical protein
VIHLEPGARLGVGDPFLVEWPGEKLGRVALDAVKQRARFCVRTSAIFGAILIDRSSSAPMITSRWGSTIVQTSWRAVITPASIP